MSIIEAKEKKKMIAFGWYGGKYSHLDWLLLITQYSSLL
jgi:DNA adenine methylase